MKTKNGNIANHVVKFVSKHKGKIALGTGITFLIIFQACKEKDPCEGVKDTNNTKKRAMEVAANTMRITFREIQESPFASIWNPSFSGKMQLHLQNSGNGEPTTKDTAIVAGEMCDTYLEQYGSNPQFEADVGSQMRNNREANKVYIMTLDDWTKYFAENEACIVK